MATNKSVSSAKSSAHIPDGSVDIPLSDVYVDNKWNARADLGEAAGGPEETTGLDGLKASLKTRGQDTPVIVRPRYPHEKFRQPFFLVAGFRRVRAISENAAELKDPKPTVKAFVRNMTEADARELNLRENTARENLSGPDLAFGVASMYEASVKTGVPATQTSISLALNLSQPYVGKLLKIAGIKGTYKGEDGKEVPILDHWRSAMGKATVEQMYRVASCDTPEKQAELYAGFARGGSGPDKRDPKAKLEAMVKTASKWGRVLGILVHEGAIDMQDDDVFFSTYLDKFMSIPEDMKTNDKRKLVEAAEEAFGKAAEHGEAKPEDDKTEGEATSKTASKAAPKGKGKGKASN